MGRAPEPFGVGGLEIGYVTDDGLEHRVAVAGVGHTVRVVQPDTPVFTSHKGQRTERAVVGPATTGSCTSGGAVTASCWCRKGFGLSQFGAGGWWC